MGAAGPEENEEADPEAIGADEPEEIDALGVETTPKF